jgi:small subunit ribosomal protein S6
LQKYETIFVVDSLLKTEEIEAIITKHERFVSANGGEINATEKWGKKRLAYEIKKRQYGYYVLIRFDGPAAMIKQLEREYRLNESILRYMTLQLSKQALKALDKQLSYAQAEEDIKKAATSEEPKKPETSEKPEPALEKETTQESQSDEAETAEPVSEEGVSESSEEGVSEKSEEGSEESVSEKSEEGSEESVSEKSAESQKED